MIICTLKIRRFLCANCSFCQACLIEKDTDNMLISKTEYKDRNSKLILSEFEFF